MFMAPPITKRQNAMVDLLRKLGPGWHSRGAMAAARGIQRLSPLDVEALDELAVRGFIVERSLEPRRAGEAVSRWVYRLKGGDEPDQTDKP